MGKLSKITDLERENAAWREEFDELQEANQRLRDQLLEEQNLRLSGPKLEELTAQINELEQVNKNQDVTLKRTQRALQKEQEYRGTLEKHFENMKGLLRAKDSALQRLEAALRTTIER